MREITYSTKPVTVENLIQISFLLKQQWEVLVPFLLARTDLTEPEILALETDELTEILENVSKSFNSALILSNLGKQL